ncbi:MAG: hypothetical protein ACRC7Q_02650, partial [Plesiomonas shigelloides]
MTFTLTISVALSELAGNYAGSGVYPRHFKKRMECSRWSREMTHKKTMINTLLMAALFGGVNVAQAADVPA